MSNWLRRKTEAPRQMSLKDFQQTVNISISFTKAFPRDYQAEIERKIRAAIVHFPSLKDIQLKVGYCGNSMKREASACPQDHKVWFKHNPNMYTIGHELMHLEQYVDPDIPFGEKSCDIYTLARSIDFCDYPPCYLEIGLARCYWSEWRNIAHKLACEAIKQREGGRRNYIKWWEEEFKSARKLIVDQEVNEQYGIGDRD